MNYELINNNKFFNFNYLDLHDKYENAINITKLYSFKCKCKLNIIFKFCCK